MGVPSLSLPWSLWADSSRCGGAVRRRDRRRYGWIRLPHGWIYRLHAQAPSPLVSLARQPARRVSRSSIRRRRPAMQFRRGGGRPLLDGGGCSSRQRAGATPDPVAVLPSGGALPWGLGPWALARRRPASYTTTVVDGDPSAVCRYSTRHRDGVGAPGPIAVLPSGGALSWWARAQGAGAAAVAATPPWHNLNIAGAPERRSPARPSTRAALRETTSSLTGSWVTACRRCRCVPPTLRASPVAAPRGVAATGTSCPGVDAC
jgi:hypothetical protein